MATARTRQPKADCETVMNFGLPLAQAMLKQHGEFLPFGAAMRPLSHLRHRRRDSPARSSRTM